jgi:phosphate transport system substrate-binding protein
VSDEGSATAFDGLAQERCEIGLASVSQSDASASGQLKRAAQSVVLEENVIGLDGIAIIAHWSNPVVAVSMRQLRDILTGRITDWSQLGRARSGRITLHIRDQQSGTLTQVELHTGMVETGERLTNASTRYADSEELSLAVSDDPDGLGFVSRAFIGTAHTIGIRPEDDSEIVLPKKVNISAEDYPLTRRLYFYTKPKPSGLTHDFVEYVLADAGQRIVERFFVSLMIGVDPDSACGTRCNEQYRSLTSAAQKLTLTFRFKPASAELDSRAERDLRRLREFLARPNGRESPNRLILVGFTDNLGTHAKNLELAEARASTIRARLVGGDNTLAPGAVKWLALGEEQAVASNQFEQGRSRNRRVEVWIEH